MIVFNDYFLLLLGVLILILLVFGTAAIAAAYLVSILVSSVTTGFAATVVPYLITGKIFTSPGRQINSFI